MYWFWRRSILMLEDNHPINLKITACLVFSENIYSKFSILRKLCLIETLSQPTLPGRQMRQHSLAESVCLIETVLIIENLEYTSIYLFLFPSRLVLDLTDKALRWLAIALVTAGDFSGMGVPLPLNVELVKFVLIVLGRVGPALEFSFHMKISKTRKYPLRT